MNEVTSQPRYTMYMYEQLVVVRFLPNLACGGPARLRSVLILGLRN